MNIKTEIKNLNLHLIDGSGNLKEKFDVIVKNKKFLCKYLKWPNNISTTEDVLNYTNIVLQQIKNREKKVFEIQYENKYIGQIDLQKTDYKKRVCEIGYWLDEEYNGNGYMTECVKTILEYIFKELKFKEVYIYINPLNDKSKNIPKRLNFDLLENFADKYEVYVKSNNIKGVL